MDELNRRDFMVGIGALAMQISAGIAIAGVLRNRCNESMEPTNSISTPGARQRAAVIVVNFDKNPSTMKHIIYDNKFMDAPQCFVSSGLGSQLTKYKDGLPWKPIAIVDEDLFEMMGEIPSGGKPLPESCYKSGAKWITRALRAETPDPLDVAMEA